jgi:hypothetical protein
VGRWLDQLLSLQIHNIYMSIREYERIIMDTSKRWYDIRRPNAAILDAIGGGITTRAGGGTTGAG